MTKLKIFVLRRRIDWLLGRIMTRRTSGHDVLRQQVKALELLRRLNGLVLRDRGLS